MDSLRLQRTAKTGSAAQACIECIERNDPTGVVPQSSPLFTVVDLIKRLESDKRSNGQFWWINDRASKPSTSAAISAWPLWFSEQSRNDERPLFYMTQSATSAHLSMLTSQTGQRGIILNDIESSPSRWAKGAHPWLPLWLASNRQCTPFDPASGDEARAILAGALNELYVQGAPGFCYMTLHDESGDGIACDRKQTYLGMYRLDTPAQGKQQVRLLGAGLMLREVQAAAQILQDEWGIAAEVWSCPSYTKLARDADAHSRHKRRSRGETPANSHLQDCLNTSETPVIAVTGYAEFVAAQLAAHVRAPFRALGADSLEPHQRLNRHWIALTALRELASQEQINTSLISKAMKRYRLV
ncbi:MULTISPECIES: transketolase-like TK C-terminal-containing protein [unclassified Pseudomonas]|uniref:transketolase-like TK C-terminal-containing protein n=1 Tax=unclassified Pseudomonas TaxID=196821 RepID=UPI0025F26474|nr:MULTISPECIES: pyruvate dehydrogenase [unclassified Pseudomonas]